MQKGNTAKGEISRMTGIHVATLNKRLRGLVKGTGHWLGRKRASKVLKEGKRDSQARHSVSRSGLGVSRLSKFECACACIQDAFLISFFNRGGSGLARYCDGFLAPWLPIYRY